MSIYTGVPFGVIQTTVTDQMDTANDAQLANASDYNLCDAIAVGEDSGLPLGAGVVVETIPAHRAGINSHAAVLPTADSTAADFKGFIVRTAAAGTDANGVNLVRKYRMATILRTERVGGRIWLRMANAFTEGTRPFWRIKDLVKTDTTLLGRISGSAITGTVTIPATYATGTLTFAANPTNGQNVKIGTTTYTFKDVLAAANDIKIGASVVESIATLVKVVNGAGVEGVDYFAGTTTPNASARALSNNLVVQVTATDAGVAGNNVDLTSTAATASAAKLAGGVDAKTEASTDTVQLTNCIFRNSGKAGDLALVELHV